MGSLIGGPVAKALGLKSKRQIEREERRIDQASIAAQPESIQEKKKRLRIGASAQIATTPLGILGEPLTGRRRLSV